MGKRLLQRFVLGLLLVTSFELTIGTAPAYANLSRVGPTDVYGPTSSAGTSSGTAVSGTSTFYSLPTNLGAVRFASYDLYWGAVTGTFTVQVSNKPSPNTANDNDWKAITLSRPITQPAGSSSGDYVDLSWLPFMWVRLKYVNASGTGNVQAFLFAKE